MFYEILNKGKYFDKIIIEWKMIMKKTIEDFNLKDKKVIIRVDFNVPMNGDKITDDNRIKQSLKTIEYAIKKGAKVILLSHLGRVKEEADKIKNDLKPVAFRLGELLKKEVKFIPETRGELVEKAISDMNSGDIILLQNTRYEDLDGKKESKNDADLGKYWASLGDIYINDAFGTAHRAHASNVGIASNLPSGVGFLIEKELKIMKEAIDHPKRPFTIILGGSKVSDKIGVIENLVKIADHLLIGGAMAYTFLKAAGFEIGKSLLDEENIEFCKKMLEEYSDKIVLPIDSVNALEINEDASFRQRFINEIKEDEIGLDIGYGTIKLFKNYLQDSKTIIWNGPVGYSELENFSNGTKGLLEVLKNSEATTIIGGGDTASAAINFGYEDALDHISTGGGASLELLEGKELPGIICIEDKNER